MLALFGAALSLINFSIDEIINPKLRNQTRAARRGWRMSRQQLENAREATL
jgi:peptide/nickel transport system permease protein